jgi:hypothetical protein
VLNNCDATTAMPAIRYTTPKLKAITSDGSEYLIDLRGLTGLVDVAGAAGWVGSMPPGILGGYDTPIFFIPA